MDNRVVVGFCWSTWFVRLTRLRLTRLHMQYL